jgi:hypothetical protein
LETIEKILPDIDKVIVDGRVGDRLMPLLPMASGQLPVIPPAAVRPPTPEPQRTR